MYFMERIKSVIYQYLTTETYGAQLITGTWGVGKTYFLNNYLNTFIKGISNPKKENLKYNSIVVSLFGIRDVEELSIELILAIARTKPNYNKNKYVYGIYKIIRTIASSKNINLDNLIKASQIIKEEDLSKYVIILDDFERLSKSIDQESLLGLISMFVDQMNLKVIIFANEIEIKLEKYSSFKEKVIGNTLEFESNIFEAYNEIIKKFTDDISYIDFLRNYKEELIKFIRPHTDNLRTVIFILNNFQVIFKSVNSLKVEHEFISKYYDDVIVNILEFSIYIAIEFKADRINYKNRRGLDLHPFHLFDSTLENIKHNSSDDGSENQYRNEFTKKYYGENSRNFNFYDSLYDYLTGGNVFMEPNLKKEILKNYNINDEKLSDEDELLSNLYTRSAFDYEDEEYEEILDKLEKYALEGKYQVGNYLTIFDRLTEFRNPDKISVEELTEKLISAINMDLTFRKYDEQLSNTFSLGEKLKDNLNAQRICKEIKKVNLQLLDKRNLQNYNELESLLYSGNFEEFYKQATTYKEGYSHHPFLSSFNANRFSNYLIGSNNITNKQILNFLVFRYNNDNNVINNKSELHFFRQLSLDLEKYNIEKYNNESKHGLRFNLDKLFLKRVNEIKEKLEKVNRANY